MCSTCHTMVERTIKTDNVKCFGCKKESMKKYKKQWWHDVGSTKDKLRRLLKSYEKYTEKEEGY